MASAAVLWLSTAVPSAISQAPDGFAVAVVDEAGLLVPFARFDGTGWERVWREPGGRPEAPASLRVPADWFPPDGNVPDKWHLWLIVDPRVAASPFEARAARVVSVDKAVVFEAHCVEQVGLQSDYRGPADQQLAANVFPKRKAGVALSVASVRVEQANTLDPASPVARTITDRSVQAFHRAEDDHLEILDARERPSLQPFAARRSVPVRWTKVVRLGTAQAPDRTYYLEGDVTYSPTAVMVGHVWMQISADRETTDAEVMLTDADHKLAKTRTPVGIIRAGDRRFWVFETDAWEHETYEIVEASGQGQRPLSLLEVAGGGC